MKILNKMIMNKIFLIATVCVFFSCKSESEKRKEENEKNIDNLKKEIEVTKRVEELMNESTKDYYTDTIGLSNSPVKVFKYEFVKKEYSNYKDIKLHYKNVSKKNITAIRFEWYGENAFNEPADMGSYTLKGVGGGFTDEYFNSGASTTGVWEINSKDGKKIISARAYEVMFDDGTNWKLRNH